MLDCIGRGSVYESAKWHNTVFVGRDDDGKARYATLRGTNGDFKRDADGSDKRFGFVLPPKKGVSDTVAVTESPVDALSHQALCPEFGGWRLSLGCTALAALTNFLERHGEVKTVVACTDNDGAGNKAAAKIAELPDIEVVRHLPPAGKKDWNDALMALRSVHKPSLIGRLEAAKVAAAETNGLAVREKAGDTFCL
jgi:predicted deacylase